MLSAVLFGTLLAVLAGTGALRWIGKAILLLICVCIVGVGPLLAGMAVGALFALARGTLDVYLYGDLY